MSLSWPWHFVSVSAAEKQQRRELLDFRGYVAQCSVLVVVLAIRVYQNYAQDADAVRQRSRHRQQSWWDLPPLQSWTETRRQYLISLVWLGWLLSLSAWKTGEDYIHLTKSLGQVGLSQLPIQVLMAPASYISTSKPASPSILSSLTSLPQPFLNPYHRLFGRLVLGPLLLGHALLYLAFFLQSPSPHPDFTMLLGKRVRDPDVQWGLGTVSIAILVIFVLTRPLGQRRGVWLGASGSMKDRRERFYIAHVMLVGVFCLGAYTHVEQARVFVLETLVGFGLNLGWSMLYI